MTDLRLRATFSANNPRVAPLLAGAVQPTGVEIEWDTGDMGEMAARHLREDACDLFEFSISDYLSIRGRGDARWDRIALPVFLSKALLQLNTWVNVDSGIEGPADLREKRFAVGDYTMTAFLWLRAMVDRLYGIRSQDIAWYNGRDGEHSHAFLLGLKDRPPSGVSITFLDREDTANALLQAGQIDAAGATGLAIDTTSPRVRRLFPDGGRAFVGDFFAATGFLGVNHTVVMQRRLAEEHPWLPEALFEAFERSKQEAYLREPAARRVFRAGEGAPGPEADFGPDPYAFGLAANRAMLTMGTEQSRKDGLIGELPNVDELFCASLRNS